MRDAVAEHAPNLRTAVTREGLVIFTDHVRAEIGHCTDESGACTLVGLAFDGEGRRVGQSFAIPGARSRSVESLFERIWGSYVAIVRDESTGNVSIARDPSGGLPAHLVDAGGVAVLCDDLPPWLVKAIDRSLKPDPERLATALALPTILAHSSLLSHVTMIPAGAALDWQARVLGCEIKWNAPRARRTDPQPDAIRSAVLMAARSWARELGPVLLELSGGLDSSILLGALRQGESRMAVSAINLATCQAGGDERGPARDACARWGVPLAEFIARAEEMDFARALSGPMPVQPLLYGFDPLLEGFVAGTARAFGVGAIMTGQGGDAAFFQFPSHRVAIDYFRDVGPAALFSAVALDAARRTGKSLWRVQWCMLKDRLAGTPADRMPPDLDILGPLAREAFAPELADHPWVAAATDLPPGKQAQIFALANSQMFNGPTRRCRIAPMIHPLMAQPVMEACLARPTYELSHGTQDRALARKLFADLLPASVARRRLKGEASTHYRRAMLANLPFLRSHLLDGCLVANRLLDPDILAATLDENVLMSSAPDHAPASLCAFESWARHWGL